MLLHGPPGTGKTRVANSIVTGAEEMNLEWKCTATTGVAATLLQNGTTINFLLAMFGNGEDITWSNGKHPVHLRSDLKRPNSLPACLIVEGSYSMSCRLQIAHETNQLATKS